MEKAKLFAQLANFETKQNQKTWISEGVNKQDKENKYAWQLHAIVKLETDYDLLGEKGGFEKNDEYNIMWKNRSLQEIQQINDMVRWHEHKYINDFTTWMIVEYEDDMFFEYIQLSVSNYHQPYWNIKMTYKTHLSDSLKMTEKIQETFDHYFRSGNVNFSLLKTKWVQKLFKKKGLKKVSKKNEQTVFFF